MFEESGHPLLTWVSSLLGDVAGVTLPCVGRGLVVAGWGVGRVSGLSLRSLRCISCLWRCDMVTSYISVSCHVCIKALCA